jgi:hypothetical protein
MRNLVIRFALWLLRRMGANPVNAGRIINGADAVARGARWEDFYREQGGLADMLDAIRREAFEVAAEVDPRDTDLIHYWATADRNVRKLQQRIEAVISAGKLEAAQIKQLDRINSANIIR